MSVLYGYRTNQGQPLGVLMLDTVFPRIPGDVGNGFTFDFPVRYYTVKGADPKRVVKEADQSLLAPFIEGAKELEAAGCRAISTSCGFLVMFQKELSAAVKIPVLTSSLLQTPFLCSMLDPSKKVGILTARASSLGERHFRGAGMENCGFVVQGMDDYPEFTNAFIENNPEIDVEKAEAEMVDAAQKLVSGHPEVAALLFECTNMPPFAHAVQKATGLPVFDVTTLIRYMAGGVMRGTFAEKVL